MRTPWDAGTASQPSRHPDDTSLALGRYCDHGLPAARGENVVASARVASTVPAGARAAVAHAARAGTASGLNDVLLAAAAFAVVGAIVGFAFGPAPVTQTPAIPAPGDLSAQPIPLPQDA